MLMSTSQASQLFPHKQHLPQVSEAEYAIIEAYINVARAFAQMTYKSVYIIDYARLNFPFVSDNPLFLGGKTVDEVQNLGYEFYSECVPEEDMAFLKQVNQAGFSFYAGLPLLERKHYSISYNFHIEPLDKKGEKLLINHQISPLALDAKGNMWLGLCLVSLAASSEVGTAYITNSQTGEVWQFSPKSGKWKATESITLNEHEKAVIRLANQGFSVSDIAKQLHRSEDSIKGYRKKLFAKLGVSSISEAIALSTQRRLL